MRRKQNHSTTYITFPAVNLYYEDLKQMYDLLKSESEELIFEINEYELDNFNDIKEIHEQISYIKFTTKNPDMVMEMKKEISLFSYDQSMKAKGMINEINQIITKRRIFFSKGVSDRLVSFFAALPFLIVFLLSTGAITNPNIEYVLVVILILVWLVSLTLIFSNNRKSKYFNSTKKQTPNFFERNKDAIILLFIGAILGWGLGKFF